MSAEFYLGMLQSGKGAADFRYLAEDARENYLINSGATDGFDAILTGNGFLVEFNGGPNGAPSLNYTGNCYHTASDYMPIVGNQERSIYIVFKAPDYRGLMGWGLGSPNQLCDVITIGNGLLNHFYGDGFYTGALDLSVWIAALFVWRSTNNPNNPNEIEVTFYSNNVTKNYVASLSTGYSELRIGTDHYLGPSNDTRKIAEVSVWGHALSQTELARLRTYTTTQYQLSL